MPYFLFRYLHAHNQNVFHFVHQHVITTLFSVYYLPDDMPHKKHQKKIVSVHSPFYSTHRCCFESI